MTATRRRRGEGDPPGGEAVHGGRRRSACWRWSRARSATTGWRCSPISRCWRSGWAAGVLFQMLVVQAAVVRLIGGMGIGRYYRAILEAILVAFLDHLERRHAAGQPARRAGAAGAARTAGQRVDSARRQHRARRHRRLCRAALCLLGPGVRGSAPGIRLSGAGAGIGAAVARRCRRAFGGAVHALGRAFADRHQRGPGGRGDCLHPAVPTGCST